MENKPDKAGPKDVFLHLFGIIALYVSAVALINLLFGFVNLAFPDPLRGDYFNQAVRDSMRLNISLLIIIFPAYVAVTWHLGKIYSATPGKRDLRIRKWLIYLTLFISSLVLVGDLVVLVNSLLRGDITAAFILKILAVLLVVGGIFFYYLHDVRRHRTE